jgi:hypothetical protein
VGSNDSGYAVLMAGVLTVATLVVLARRLPCHSEPGSYLWPPDALIDGIVDQGGEFRLCFVPDVSGVLDLLKRLGYRRVGDPSRHACGFS